MNISIGNGRRFLPAATLALGEVWVNYKSAIGRISLAAGLVLVQATASAQIVTTLAGSGASVTTLAGSGARGGVDGDGAEASFSGPSGVAVDSSGNVYVADRGNHKIRKIAPSGTVTTLAGSGVAGGADGRGTAASFRFPTGVAVDASGNVYVTEQSYWAYAGGSDADIRRITPDGEVTTVAALGQLVMTEAGLAVDTSGNLYVADAGDIADGGRGKILKIAPDGVVTILAGSGTTNPVSNPLGLAVGSLEGLYVADAETGYVTKLEPGGSSEVLARNLNIPAGVTVDGSGNVYVAEPGSHAIRKVAPDGTVTTVAGTGLAGDSDGPGTEASFNFPTGVALDRSGNLYVADRDNNRIRKIVMEARVGRTPSRRSFREPL
jgi:sugar lactone lactonase YvrE